MMQIGEVNKKGERARYRLYDDRYYDGESLSTFGNVVNFRLNSNNYHGKDDYGIDFPKLHSLLIGDNTFPNVHDFSLRSTR